MGNVERLVESVVARGFALSTNDLIIAAACLILSGYVLTMFFARNS